MHTTANSDAKVIRQYRERIDELEEELRQVLNRREREIVMFPREWGLRPACARALAALYRRKIVPHAEMQEAIVWDLAECLCPENVVGVQIKNLRQKVKGLGIEIINIKTVGFQLTAASREIIRAAVEAQDSA